MSFMQPEVYDGFAYEVETDQGTSIIPADLVSLDLRPDIIYDNNFDEDWTAEDFRENVEALKPYLDGDEVYSIEYKEGWLARLSAPGYLDSTDYNLYDSEEEAKQGLEELYGKDYPEG